MASIRPAASRHNGHARSHNTSKSKLAVPAEPDSSDYDDLRLLRQGHPAPPPIDEAAANRPVNTGFKVSFSFLPPSMGEEEFIQHFGPLPFHDHFFYKPPLQIGMVPRSSAAVINFLDKNELADWFEKLHGYMLTDERGEEYVIEGDIMINQELPKIPVVEKDELEGTLEDTAEFQQFRAHYEDAHGEFKDPPIPGEVLQEIMLKEIEERKAKADVLKDTPLVLYLRERERNNGEQEKARILKEIEADLLKVAKEKRRQERKEQRDREKTDRKELRDKEKEERRKKERQEQAAKEELRKEAARRAKGTKHEKQASERGGAQAPPGKLGGMGLGKVLSEVNPGATPAQSTSGRNTGDDSKECQTAKHEVASGTGGGRGKGYEWRHSGEKTNRSSSGLWDGDRETPGSSNKREQDNEGCENWREGPKPPEPKSNAISKYPPRAQNDTVSFSTTAAGSEVKGEDRREPKKKIVKKIMKVKKVWSGNVEEGVGASSSSAKVKMSVAPEAAGGFTPTAGTRTSASDSRTQTEAKKTPKRPDRELYYPGAWRRNKCADQGENRKSGRNGQQQAQKEG